MPDFPDKLKDAAFAVGASLLFGLGFLLGPILTGREPDPSEASLVFVLSVLPVYYNRQTKRELSRLRREIKAMRDA